MPSEVVLTSRVTPLSACAALSQRSTTICRPSSGREGDAEVDRRALRAIDQAQLGNAGLDQGRDDRPRRAAGAQHDDRAGLGAPVRGVVAQRRHEAEAVAVAAFQAAVGLLDHGVHRADVDRQRIDAIEQRHDLDLVRQGEVAAARIGRAPQERHQLLQRRPIGLDRQAAVMAVDPVLLQPEAVQRGRARMLDRPADDAGERPAARLVEELVVALMPPAPGRCHAPPGRRAAAAAAGRGW